MRQRILALLAEGKTYSQIVAELGCAKSTVAYHAKNVKQPPNYKVHDWAAVQKHYDEGNSGLQCMARFGICRGVWYNASKHGKLILREDLPIPLEVLTAAGRKTSRAHLRWRLLKAGVFADGCSICGTREWLDKPPSLHLHHMNGIATDNCLENLQMLCPQCHTQTDSYAGRNARNNTKK